MVENRVKEFRKELHLSQAQLAAKSGVPRSTISEIETGAHQPSLEVALLLYKALNVPIDELFWVSK